MHELSKNIKLILAKPAQAASTDAVPSDVIDMQGFEGVLFVTRFGTANDGNFIKVQQGALPDLSDAVDLKGTKVVSGTDPSNEVCAIDIYKPTKRYLRLHATRGTSSTLGDTYAIQYQARKAPPVSALSGTLVIETHVSPEEGTA